MIPVGLFSVRQAEETDLERIVELDQLFGNVALTRDYFEAWLRHHPQGFLVAEYDGRIYGYSMVIYLHKHQIHENWYLDTGGGTCSTHSPLGEYLYAVSIASQKQEAARALFIANRRTFIRSHVYQTIIFGRLPRFRKWVESQGYNPNTLTPEIKRRLLNLYVNTLHDPYQVFYEGLSFMPEYGVVDYLEGDADSLNCALKLVWRNPYYRPLYRDRAMVETASPSGVAAIEPRG
ncbi:MAG: GNAT family N-acetyltransferase [Fimbriimonadales bacterium]